MARGNSTVQALRLRTSASATNRRRRANSGPSRALPFKPSPKNESPAEFARRLRNAQNQILALHESHLGCTWNLYQDDLRGRKLYSVSFDSSRTVKTTPKSFRGDLARFLIDNLELLVRQGISLGTWLNSDTGQIEIDVVQTLARADEAIRVGRERGQIAIWDLGLGEVILL